MSMNTSKQKSFQETQTSFHKCIKHQIFFDTQLQPLGFLGITTLSTQENNMPKKRLDSALVLTS